MNMYVGNLSYNVKESDLRQVMEEYGTVESVKLITATQEDQKVLPLSKCRKHRKQKMQSQN